MANDEHVELLRQGAAAWNAWRAEHPDVIPDVEGESFLYEDLSGADLRGMSCHHQVFSGATLVEARFGDAYLGHADLSDSDIRGASFKGADLSCANLFGADAQKVDFGGAILREVSLKEADLRGATLVGADLSRAYMVATDFGSADLEGVTGLTAEQLADAGSLEGVRGLDAQLSHQIAELRTGS